MRTAPLRLLAVLLFVLPAFSGPAPGREPVAEREAAPQGDMAPQSVYLFWQAGCPHCAKARRFLEERQSRTPPIVLRTFELGADPAVDAAFLALCERFGISPPAVPLIMVGSREFAGFEGALTTGEEIEAAIAACRSGGCPDVTAPVLAAARNAGKGGTDTAGRAPPAVPPRALPETVHLPLIGAVSLRSLPMPLLTIVLGAADGFNPCAMWVLVFLIGLLIGLRDPVRMWTYGAVFLLTSAAVYFAFLAAWLNLFLAVGVLAFVRTGVGLFALGAGGWYLYEFARNPEAVCPVTSPGARTRTMDRLRALVAEPSALLAIGEIAGLAVAVNMVELLCSAGLPAVYTQILAQGNYSGAAHYGYLALYIAVFMLDDAAVFLTAMLTLQATGFTAAYSRASHLIGGAVLMAVGLALIFRPEWLAFA